MVRILHVEDEESWRDVVKTTLGDHVVDSAADYDEALSLIRNNPPYALALIDLNLFADDDNMGGEVLDLLLTDYPATRRVVITGSPPRGAVRANVFERYGVDEIIIKGELTAPDLRRVVASALTSEPVVADPQIRIRRSELKHRLSTWVRSESAWLGERVQRAEEHYYAAAQVHPESRRRALDALEAAKSAREAFAQHAMRLEHLIDTVSSISDVDHILELVEAAEAQSPSLQTGTDEGA